MAELLPEMLLMVSLGLNSMPPTTKACGTAGEAAGSLAVCGCFEGGWGVTLTRKGQ